MSSSSAASIGPPQPPPPPAPPEEGGWLGLFPPLRFAVRFTSLLVWLMTRSAAAAAAAEKKCLNSELWHACAGPLVCLPTVGTRVVYFPQGHSEQVRLSSPPQPSRGRACFASLSLSLLVSLVSDAGELCIREGGGVDEQGGGGSHPELPQPAGAADLPAPRCHNACGCGD
jgi:hypothetical protein